MVLTRSSNVFAQLGSQMSDFVVQLLDAAGTETVLLGFSLLEETPQAILLFSKFIDLLSRILQHILYRSDKLVHLILAIGIFPFHFLLQAVEVEVSRVHFSIAAFDVFEELSEMFDILERGHG